MRELILKGKSSKDFDLIIHKWSRPPIAEIRDVYIEMPGTDGMIHNPEGLGMLPISIDFAKFVDSAVDWTTRARNIVSWLYSRGEIEIRFDDEPDMYYIGKVVNVPAVDFLSVATSFTVELNCQPLKRGHEHTETMLNDEILEYDGSYETEPIIELTLNEGASKLELSINNMNFVYDAPVKAGDVITLDCKELELFLNDEMKLLELSGHFPVLQVGDNLITSNVSSVIKVKWQDMYL